MFLVTNEFYLFIGIFCSGLESSKPQLRSIYRVLNDLFMRQTAQGFQTPLDLRVVQHLSPACRASHHPIARHLTASSALLTLDDYDSFKCKNGFYAPPNVFGMLILFFPVLFAILSTAFSDVILDTMLPSIFSGLVLGNLVLYYISIFLLFLPYLVLLAYLVWIFLIYNPSNRRVEKLGRRSENQRWVEE